MSERDGDAERSAALYALVRRLGGQAIIALEEMPEQPYSILRRQTEAGGLEIRVLDDGAAN